MRAVKTDRWHLALALVLLLGGPAAFAQDDPGEPYGDDYRYGDYGRIRDAERGLEIVRAEWDHQQGTLDEGVVNSPIFAGDRIRTGPGQRVEIELAGGTLVWVDDRTELTFLSLPDPYAQIPDHTVLQLASGRIRLSTSLGDEEEFRVDTPAASVYPLGNAELRIDVAGGGDTRVESRRGVVEVVGNGGSVLVRGGTRTEVLPGQLPYEASPFNTFASDRFDRYVAAREEIYRYDERYAGNREVYRELPSQVRPYYRELSTHGRWIDVDEYGVVWQPVGVAADWRPYHDGYWGYGPHGYFWISHEPWGWAPYHYGRWTWIGSRGWCWSPGRVFGGAWVSWSWGSVYVGWSPLDYWNYPACRSLACGRYYDPYAWTFVSYHHIHHRHYHRYSVSWNHVQPHVHRSVAVTRPPRVSPRRLAHSTAARQRAIDDLRADPRGRLTPRAARSRSAERSFRTSEGVRPGRSGVRAASRREAPPVPVGRARTTPTITRSRTARPPARRGESIRTPPGAGRERLPVVKTPRSRPSRELTDRRSSPLGTNRSGDPRSLPRPARPGSGNDDDRSGIAGRVRDIYRKMAKPRSTRERPSAEAPRTDDRSRRAQPSRPPRAGSTSTDDDRKPAPRVRPRSSEGARPTAPRVKPKSREGSRKPTPRTRSKSSGSSRAPAPRARPKPKKSSPSRSRAPRARNEISAPSRAPAPRPRARASAPSRAPAPRPRARASAPSRAPAPRSTPRASAPSRSPAPRSSARSSGGSRGGSKSRSSGSRSSRGRRR